MIGVSVLAIIGLLESVLVGYVIVTVGLRLATVILRDSSRYSPRESVTVCFKVKTPFEVNFFVNSA
ncbi:hypothetical protein D3C76_1015750 [compost metagenome]